MLNSLDLFSGIGGIGLALKPWVRTITYCEQDRYAQGVLLSRMQSGDVDRAPIWDDVCTLSADILPSIDIIFGGFPCQDISVAGAGRGLDGERSGLFFEICRLARELQPRFVFLENVPAISIRGLDRVLLEFTSLGYDTRWTTISAASVGAPHRRERWFLLAHSNGERGGTQQVSRGEQQTPANAFDDGKARNDSDSNRKGLEEFGGIGHGQTHRNASSPGLQGFGNPWTSEPCIRGGNNGVSNRVDRIKCLGNSVVPLQVRTAFEFLIKGGAK